MAPSFDDESFVFNFVVKDGNGVKGLVDSGLTEVPSLYIQPPHKRINMKQIETASSPEMMMTIDLSELDGPNHDQVVKAIGHAAETQGFFQVVNHGVPLELLESLKAAAHKFFEQPSDKKASYLKEVSPSPMVKYGTSFAPEIEKVNLQWRDFLSMTYTNDVDALKFWPNQCKGVALEYIRTSREMVERLLKALMGYLGVNIDDSRSIIDTLIGLRMVRMNFYPTCPNPELTTGVGRHADFGTLTVLLQDGIGGLLMKKGASLSNGNEYWIKVPPIHGALVINVGDVLQIISNGRYKSLEHIVQTTTSSSRVSVPIFYAPQSIAKIGPLPELVVGDGVARYRELIFEDYMNNYFVKVDHGGKKSLDVAST